jgi:hypothetical protein
MARRGFVKLKPSTPAPKAKNTGNEIFSPIITLPNSLDILIDNTPDVTQSENSVSVDPNQTPEALNSNISIGGVTVLGVSGFETTNQGLNWTGDIAPVGGKGDPAAAISNDGRYYIGFVNDNWGQSVAVSTDQGNTWQAYIVASIINPNNPNSILDKNHLWVDKSLTSSYANNIYSAWTDFDGPDYGRIVFSRSTDGGVTWSQGINISYASAGDFDHGVNIHSGPNGEVYAVWAIYDSSPADESAIGFASSSDGGSTFNSSQRIVNGVSGIRNTGLIGKTIRVNSFPSMAVDNSFGPNRGTIYVVWANRGPLDDVDIYLVKSTNGGASWSGPTKINTSTPGAGKQHFFSWITCDQVTGKLHVIYYDDRNTSITDCETWVSSSFDGGSTWDDYKVSDVSFTPHGIIGNYFGDYLGVTANDDIIYPVWTDNRTPPGYALAYTSPLISSDFCPVNLTLQNITMPVVGTYKYRAQNDINVANTGTIFTLQGNGTTGARASMVAGGDITLYNNTTVELGATLTIVPGPCNSPILRPVYYDPKNKNEPIQLKEFDIASNINLYPNPVNGILYLELSDEFQKKKSLTYEIKGLMMNTVQRGNIKERFTQINTSNLLTGGYLVCVYENNVLLETKKIIKL